MTRFIIERNLTPSQVNQVESLLISAETIAQQSKQLATQKNHIEWIMTITTAAKIYAIYDAPSAEYLRQIAHRRKFTIHRLLLVQNQS